MNGSLRMVNYDLMLRTQEMFFIEKTTPIGVEREQPRVKPVVRHHLNINPFREP